MKLYIVEYCANEFDDLGYESPYPIYYSLDEVKARNFFETKCQNSIENFNLFMNSHPEFQNNEDYQIVIHEKDELEWYMGNWFYKYVFREVELNTDLRY